MTINAMTLIADKEEDLLRTAQIKAFNLGKAVYIAKLPNGQFCISFHTPHSLPWRKEKLEWRKTVPPTESK